MKDQIRRAREQQEQTSRLAASANDARERADQYEADGDGAELTSDSELRRLQRESELADDRLKRAQAPPSGDAAGESGAEPDDRRDEDDPDSDDGLPARLL